MKERFRIIEDPRTCSYLPYEVATLEYRGVLDMSGTEYADLLARGYRRFGAHLFRPACPHCEKCRSVRILAQDFDPNASDRRVIKKNADIRAELHPLFVSHEHIDLFNRYHRFMSQHRGWPSQRTNPSSYHSEFLSGPSHVGRQWLYFDGARLAGVAIMDEVPGAISLVYCFYDPEWRAQSPGKFSILTQLLYAKETGVKYAYLGYWIEESQSMGYKGRYQPREILETYPPDGVDPKWLRI